MTDDRPDHLIPNTPPPEETAGMEISDALAEFDQRRDEILAAFADARLVVTDNASVGTTADKIAIAKTLLEDIEAGRRRIKNPFDRAVKTVDGRANAYAQPVHAAIGRAEARIREFRNEARRLAAAALQTQRDEEARLARAAAAKGQLLDGTGDVVYDHHASFPTAEPVRDVDVALPVARGDYGSKVHDKREKTFEIEDVRMLPDEILLAPAVKKAMLAATKQLARLRETIPGVKIDVIAGDNIRRAG